MSLRESIQTRKSVRRYKDTCVERNIVIEVKNDLQNYTSKFGTSRVRFEVLTAEDETEVAKLGFLWGVGKINAPYCIIGICEDDQGMQELGFALEPEVLKLTSAGYGTCWLGTFDRKALNLKFNVKEKEQIGVVIAFGAAQEGGFLNSSFRKIAGSTKRKEIKEIWMNYPEVKAAEEIAMLVKMSILAPSSNNGQPVRVIIKEKRADFFLIGNSRIDAGIFMSHFYLCASEICDNVNISIESYPLECYTQEKATKYVASIFF
ncbi:MAG: nitroreductase family protein [Acetobacterium sp.]|nr:nitroreductase family protein [Acetobacterium sp.]